MAEDTSTTKTQDKSTGSSTGRFKVRLSHPQERKRVVFSSVSEARARAYLANHYPRGSEAYLEGPDGKTEHYEHERQGDYGVDADQWAAFDPEAYVPPNEVEVPVSQDWGDRES